VRGLFVAQIIAAPQLLEICVAITYLKKADKTPESETTTAQAVATTMLAAIEEKG